VQTLAAATFGATGSWGPDGVILFAALGHPIARIPAAGGDPSPISGLVQTGSVYFPHFLPDGRHFLYYVRGEPNIRGVYLGQLDGHLEHRRVVECDAGAVYTGSGHLLFVREGKLLAQRFDMSRLTVSGVPVEVSDAVSTDRYDAGVSASHSGTIAFRMSSGAAERQFVWFDRSGHEVARLGESVTTTLSRPSLSPDGARVAFYRPFQGNVDVWLFDLKRTVMSRFTSDPADDVFPVWSPDGRRIVFSSNRKGVHNLYTRSAGAAAEEQLLFASDQAMLATDWSRDGRFLLVNSEDPKRGFDIWALAVDGDRKPFPLVQTSFIEQGAQFSPDGLWIAYQSNQSGSTEIYVRPFKASADTWQVSNDGGSQVRWSRDGKELFYVSRDGRLMAVPIATGASGQPPVVGRPTALFAPPLGGAVQQGDPRHQYMVSSDGQQFLVATVKQPDVSPIRVIVNWRPKS
jgi:dipeptidyl aminopeptidase/acylaminoacyl peptidase